nr:unnamed protein product [Callosobruchus chinensis]
MLSREGQFNSSVTRP